MSLLRDERKYPDYEFREYPKWVTPVGGDPKIVHTEDEELTIIEDVGLEEPAPPPVPEPKSRKRK